MRKIITPIGFALLVVGVCIWGCVKIGTVTVESTFATGLSTLFEGVEGDYRELGGFAHTQVKARHWGRERDFILRAGCIPEDYPGTKVGIGGFNQIGDGRVTWSSSVGQIARDTNQTTTGIDIEIEFDLKNEKVTLLNTGEELPLDQARVYTAMTDRGFQVVRFQAVDPAEELSGVHSEVTGYFADVTAAQKNRAEPQR